ncbi:hypothetical protein B0H19DRAFT_1033811 [Mycena capillaripes]|nr:hypothetical protein B0H19DRAFT_1033811 [Mycena capillaripes]
MFSRSLLRPIQAHTRRFAVARSAPTASRMHSTDSYTKEVDSTPAADPSIHRVDPSSENVQKPHEAPSGPWSATGVDAGVKNAQGKHDGDKATGMEEYSTMNSGTPYTSSADNEQYGRKAKYQQDDTSPPQQGPDGTESGGRKAEGR